MMQLPLLYRPLTLQTVVNWALEELWAAFFPHLSLGDLHTVHLCSCEPGRLSAGPSDLSTVLTEDALELPLRARRRSLIYIPHSHIAEI